MTRKKTTPTLGNALAKERQRALEKKMTVTAKHEDGHTCSRSVLDQGNLEDLISMVQVRKEEYRELVGEAEVVDQLPILLAAQPLAAAERGADEQREHVSIPRRPAWSADLGPEEMEKLELATFADWRRDLARSAEKGGLLLTPYERNLDFWRQLWRCIERSDLLVQIVDARDPAFYYCHDLPRYLSEIGGDKRLMLLLNKADFLTATQRNLWAEHFASRGIDAVFFSALAEVQRHEKEKNAVARRMRQEALERRRSGQSDGVQLGQDTNPADVPVPDSDSDPEADGADAKEEAGVRKESAESDDEGAAPPILGAMEAEGLDVLDSSRLLDELLARLPPRTSERRGTVGVIGYPNVGKSTVINAIVGSKKVGMHSTPGKTKHIQTLELPAVGITLCDCPGLVFPSVVATRAHLVINNTIHIDDLRDCFPPIGLIVEKVGYPELLQHYACKEQVREAAARSGDHVLDKTHSFLAALAVARNHILGYGVPDENWAARKVLRDYVRGALLHCELPRSVTDAASQGTSEQSDVKAVAGQSSDALELRGPRDAGPYAAERCEDTDTRAEPDEEHNADEDFSDLGAFLGAAGLSGGQPNMTKRKMRHMQKLVMKGRMPTSATGDSVRVSGRGMS